MAIELINVRTYDASGNIDASLSPSIEIFDNADDSLDFSGTMSWNPTIEQYQYSANINSTKDYTVNIDFGVTAATRYATFGLSQATGGGGGGATVADIWGAQISDYSGTAGSFANKFEQYGGVSHVIDRSSLDDASKLELKGMKDKLEEFSKAIKDIKSTDGEFEKIVKLLKEQTNKTTIIKSGGQYEDTIGNLLVESIPQILDKLEEATRLIPIYEDMINYLEKRDKDWERLVEDIINNN